LFIFVAENFENNAAVFKIITKSAVSAFFVCVNLTYNKHLFDFIRY